MNLQRRRWMLALCAGGCAASAASAPDNAGALAFPRDHGAHLNSRTEWWYLTGWLGTEHAPSHGFQITFFRSATGLAAENPSRFAARQLLFGHAAVTVPGARLHLHDQGIVRWSGAAQAAPGRARVDGGDVQIGHWSLRDGGSAWHARIEGREFSLDLALARTQPLLAQGDAGISRKGPQPRQFSHYYSEPQLAAGGRVRVAGADTTGSGRAWLDHEWSDEILPAQAVGWDWLGMNLFDGSALTAFVLRRSDGSALWAGGSFRRAGEAARNFGPEAVRMRPGRVWRSPGSGATYPVQWQLETPQGAFEVRALMDAQELDSRASTGTIYWEGLSELRAADGQQLGLGYLEMTGYAAPLELR